MMNMFGLRMSDSSRGEGCRDVLILHGTPSVFTVNGKAVEGGYCRRGDAHVVASLKHV